MIGDDDGETIFGSSRGDSLIGNGGADSLSGEAGDDVLSGGAGADILQGGTGLDQLFGGEGNDALFIAPDDLVAGETYDGGADFDLLNLFGAGDTVFDLRTVTLLGLEGLTFEGQLGGGATAQLTAQQMKGGFTEIFDFIPASQAVRLEIFMGAETTLNLSGVTIQGFADPGDAIRVFGDGDNETITGTSVADTIHGGGGNDTLAGGAGNDWLNGEDGDDDLSGGSGVDTLIGGAGNDTLDGGPVPNPANQGNFLFGGDGDDTYIVRNTFDLVHEHNYIPDFAQFGGGGVDTVHSKANWFWDVYGIGERLIIDADAHDPGGLGTTIVGGVWDNEIVGNAGTNVLFGRGGSDTYRPGDGIDFISLSLLGVPEDLYPGVRGNNIIILDARQSGPTSYAIVFEFDPAKDKFNVADYGYGSKAEVFARGVNDGIGNSYFILGDGFDYAYVVGKELSALTPDIFIV